MVGYLISLSGYYIVHPQKGRVVLPQFSLVWQASGHLAIRTDTSFTSAPLIGTGVSTYLSICMDLAAHNGGIASGDVNWIVWAGVTRSSL